MLATHKLKVAVYTCITEYIFVESRIERHFSYQKILSEVRGRGNSTNFADVGCCVGSDIRQLIHDGFPAS
ncbi:hypothetical protein CC78DRAFT_474234 [Lojkania enalia]|uniref:Uncharacterized protein n=1 Tax=Lojkania enalia TaxID=147567 RepID=A0A9P4MZX8_9PLEO|nr:hypothetical protein CC78DRAFT_474234 [Didymosphaeria enalia]